MKPTGRTEVMQLKHTMDVLLNKAGISSVDQKGPTQVIVTWILSVRNLTMRGCIHFVFLLQIHNLLEIIKQEQDIYNIIFHEVIRQVTVECKERGEILAKLRERYANLLARVPRQIKRSVDVNSISFQIDCQN